MKRENCIVCGKKILHRINSVCCSKICNAEMNKNAKYYYEKIEKENAEHHKYKLMLMNKLKEMKKENLKNQKSSGYRGEAKTHIIRKIVTKNKSGDAYGITLPKSVHDKYYGYEVEHYSNGIIILVPKKHSK